MCSPKPPSSLLLISTLSEAENVADHVLLCRLRRLAPVVTIEGGGLMMWLREENRRLRMERDILKKAMACVLDAYSRRIVGWSMSDRMKQDLVLDALRMALGRRQPDQEAGLLHHSDRGSQYASAAFQQLHAGGQDHVQHEPSRQLLGQRHDGELLRHPEERTDSLGTVCDTSSGSRERVRLHRTFLQPDSVTFGSWLPEPGTVRTGGVTGFLKLHQQRQARIHLLCRQSSLTLQASNRRLAPTKANPQHTFHQTDPLSDTTITQRPQKLGKFSINRSSNLIFSLTEVAHTVFCLGRRVDQS